MDSLDLLPYEPAGRFSGEPPENAFVELHNLVAAAASTADFGPADRVRISRRRGVDLAREFRDERIGLYEAVLKNRLRDGDLGGDDRRLLDHLARTLALAAADLRGPHERAFGAAAFEAVADDDLSDDERARLLKLQHLPGLDPRLADGAYSVLARERVVRTVAAVLADGRFTPADDARIARVARQLSVEVPAEIRDMIDDAKRRQAEAAADKKGSRARTPEPTARGRKRAQRETVVDAVRHRLDTERFRTSASWQRVDGFRLEKAVGAERLRTGQTARHRVSRRALHGVAREGHVEVGRSHLVLHDRDAADRALPLDQVVQILRFRDGAVVRTKRGQHLFIDAGRDREVFYAALYHRLFGEGPD